MQSEQGSFTGSRCVAGPGGFWTPGTVHRVNEDGTFTIAPDQKPHILMPYWHGVTHAEVSFADEEKWPFVLKHISPDDKRMSRSDFAALYTILGGTPSDEEVRRFWAQTCERLFGYREESALEGALVSQQAYAFCLAAGLSAKALQAAITTGGLPVYYKLYWNQTRMGGRDPAEITRPVTLDDALTALGLKESGIDTANERALERYETTHGVRLPQAVKTLFCHRGIHATVKATHPNNPDVVVLGESGSEPFSDPRAEGLDGDYAIPLMNCYDAEWALVFNQDDEDARVYAWWGSWRLTAPTVGMFFWDLAQTGLCWDLETGFKTNYTIKQTDIGLAVS